MTSNSNAPAAHAIQHRPLCSQLKRLDPRAQASDYAACCRDWYASQRDNLEAAFRAGDAVDELVKQHSDIVDVSYIRFLTLT